MTLLLRRADAASRRTLQFLLIVCAVLGPCVATAQQPRPGSQPATRRASPEIFATRDAFLVVQLVTGPRDGPPEATATLQAIAAACRRGDLAIDTTTRGFMRVLDSLAAIRPVLHLRVVPRRTPAHPCATPELLAIHGAELDPAARELPPLGEVELSRVATPIIPLAEAQEDVRWVLSQNAIPPRAHVSLREFALPVEALFPDEAGRIPPLQVEIRGLSGAPSERFTIPATAGWRLWDSYLSWRLATLAAARTPSLPPLAIPPVRDEKLRIAVARYEAGDQAAGALLALDRRGETLLRPDDALAVAVLTAATLISLGDSDAARALLATPLRERPCLALPPGTPSPYVRALDDVRPPTRCAPVGAAIILVRSLVPGLAQVTTGRRSVGIGGMVVTGGLAAFAAATDARARQLFDDYERLNAVAEAEKRYDEAAGARSVARSAAVAAGVVALSLAGDALIRELRLARQVRSARWYGVPVEPRAMMNPQADRLLLTLSARMP